MYACQNLPWLLCLSIFLQYKLATSCFSSPPRERASEREREREDFPPLSMGSADMYSITDLGTPLALRSLGRHRCRRKYRDELLWSTSLAAMVLLWKIVLVMSLVDIPLQWIACVHRLWSMMAHHSYRLDFANCTIKAPVSIYIILALAKLLYVGKNLSRMALDPRNALSAVSSVTN